MTNLVEYRGDESNKIYVTPNRDYCVLCGTQKTKSSVANPKPVNNICLICYMKIPDYISFKQQNKYIEKLSIKKNGNRM